MPEMVRAYRKYQILKPLEIIFKKIRGFVAGEQGLVLQPI